MKKYKHDKAKPKPNQSQKHAGGREIDKQDIKKETHNGEYVIEG
jgi:hypothetical protein